MGSGLIRRPKSLPSNATSSAYCKIKESRYASDLQCVGARPSGSSIRSTDDRTAANDRSPFRFDLCVRKAGYPRRILRRVRAKRNSLSASPSGKPIAAAVFSGRAGPKNSGSCASIDDGTVMMAQSLSRVPREVVMRNGRELQSTDLTVHPRAVFRSRPYAAITAP